MGLVARAGGDDDFVGQVIDGDFVFLGQRQRAADHVLQLAHVARPRVLLEDLIRLGRETRDLFAHLFAVAIDEEFGEQAEIVAAIAERRQFDAHDVDTVIQILAELRRS